MRSNAQTARTRGPHVVTSTVRFDRDELARLRVEADRREVGWNRLVQAAVREWLEYHEGEEP